MENLGFLGKKNGSLVSVSVLFLSVFSWLSLKMRRERRLRLFFHCLGLSALGAALFLQSSVFSGLIRHGYFLGIEQSFVALAFEVALTAFGVANFFYLFLRFILSFD